MNQMGLGSAFFESGVPAHIALIGNSEPRRCGLATFTSDCYRAMRALHPEMRIDLYAMDDGAEVDYPSDVTLIPHADPFAYSEAARRIEESGAQAIWLQHEYGIFGGPAGDMVLKLLERTRLPLLTTLHTILERPDAHQKRVLDTLMERSGQVMVMAEKGRKMLAAAYPQYQERITVIPHGVPDRPYVDPDSMKARFGYERRKIILTFGLLAPDKGIDTMIRALPAIVAEHPDALYVILGATHPNIVRERGESLRGELQMLASELGVSANVDFVGRYVGLEQLCDYLQAADIYVTPYYNPAQITSGTLSYAVAMGKPVVSTPYVHATEILDEGHGILVPFRDVKPLGDAINCLLNDDALRAGYAERAYMRGRQMTWDQFARSASALLARADEGRPAKLPPRRSYQHLKPDLSAIFRMSDSTGILQHGIHAVPDRNHGYCIDDNCRALMLIHQVNDLETSLRDQWTTTYAAFVQHAWNADVGRFRNFMRFDRSWCEDQGSEDSNGRALWSLGVTMRDAPLAKHREWAEQLFDRVSGPLLALSSPRAQAFCILGAGAVLDACPDHTAARTIIDTFGRRLLALAQRNRKAGWTWFEKVLAYDNARLPQALLVAGRHLESSVSVAIGLETLSWLMEKQTAPEGHFRPVGSESFGREYAEPLPFDQQPLEAQATIEAAITALQVDPKGPWQAVAENAYCWFLGLNDIDTPLADPDCGGCFDGLTPHGVNKNQGAESLLALQFSSCALNSLSERFRNMPITAMPTSEVISA